MLFFFISLCIIFNFYNSNNQKLTKTKKSLDQFLVQQVKKVHQSLLLLGMYTDFSMELEVLIFLKTNINNFL
jgi:hypothetical protein